MAESEDEKLRSLLAVRAVAVVGLSKDPTKYSHRVAAYLKGNGYRIVPVNPFADEVLGEKCFKSLLEVPEDLQKSIELVDIFRPSEDIPPIVDEAIKLKQRHGKLRTVWMQLGIINEAAAEKARAAGLEVVMDKCVMAEHKRLNGER